MVNSRTGFLEAGSGTLEVIQRRLKWKKCAAVSVDDDDETAEAYGIVDNRSSELAEWEDNMLDAVRDLRDAGWDVGDLGFSNEELEIKDPDDDGEIAGLDMGEDLKHQVVVEVEDEQAQAELIAKLRGEGLQCRPLIS